MIRLTGMVCLVLLLMCIPVAAQDLSGKWYGSLNVTNSEGTKGGKVSMVLRTNGAELTGTAGENLDRQSAIRKGKIEGNKLTFEIQNEKALFQFELSLVNGHLKGVAKAERVGGVDGEVINATVDLQRITDPAQEQEIREEEKKADAEKLLMKELMARADMVKVLGAQLGFEMKVVKGAPYSATSEAETVQTLGDGNRITKKTTTVVYRDSEGRTRRESPEKMNGIAAEIFISDPASGVNHILQTLPRIAIKSQVGQKELDMIKMKIAAEANEANEAKAKGKPGTPETKEEILKRLQEQGATIRVDPDGSIHATGGAAANSKPQPMTESLGKQVIEGVECEGTRTTGTIPAGQIGNEWPIKIVREQWYSPELQVLVMTRQSDPRIGETTYRLTNINRSEPDRSLFEVPGDYTVREEVPLKLKKPMPASKPEEEQ